MTRVMRDLLVYLVLQDLVVLVALLVKKVIVVVGEIGRNYS
jgi:hypothetical protein